VGGPAARRDAGRVVAAGVRNRIVGGTAEKANLASWLSRVPADLPPPGPEWAPAGSTPPELTTSRAYPRVRAFRPRRPASGSSVMPAQLSPDQLARDLAVRDLTDPAAGPHAIQLVLD